MKEQEKATITYTEKGKEITKILTPMNRNQVLKKILLYFDLNVEKTGEYYIEEEIECLHFKNVVFPSNSTITFYLEENQKLILENCIFQGYKMEFERGNVELIHPIFLNPNYKFQIQTTELDNLSIVLMKNSTRKNHLSLSIHAKNFELDANLGKKLYEVFVHGCQNVNFKNLVCGLKYFDIIAYKEINFHSQNDIFIDTLRMLTNGLSLENTKIKAQSLVHNPSINIRCTNMKGQNYQLIAHKGIQINETCYYNYGDFNSLILTDKDFEEESGLEKRRQLISILKGLRDKQQINYQNYINEISESIMNQLQNQSIGKYIKNPPKVLKRKYNFIKERNNTDEE